MTAFGKSWIIDHELATNAGGSTGWGPSILVFLGVFLVITMWAVLVTEGRRKISMVYYNFELAPTKGYNIVCFLATYLCLIMLDGCGRWALVSVKPFYLLLACHRPTYRNDR